MTLEFVGDLLCEASALHRALESSVDDGIVREELITEKVWSLIHMWDDYEEEKRYEGS